MSPDDPATADQDVPMLAGQLHSALQDVSVGALHCAAPNGESTSSALAVCETSSIRLEVEDERNERVTPLTPGSDTPQLSKHLVEGACPDEVACSLAPQLNAWVAVAECHFGSISDVTCEMGPVEDLKCVEGAPSAMTTICFAS